MYSMKFNCIIQELCRLEVPVLLLIQLGLLNILQLLPHIQLGQPNIPLDQSLTPQDLLHTQLDILSSH